MTAKTRQQTIAVTGATGFVGRHVLAALEDRDLRILMRRPLTEPLPQRSTVVTGSLDDDAALARLVEGADAVLHLAGAISARDSHEFYEVNEAGTRRLAELSLGACVKRFVHMSSLAAREPQLSDYAASKQRAEDCLSEFAGTMNVAIIRAPAVYGPGDKATLPLIQQLTHRLAIIPSTPASRFSLIYVKDLARICVSSLDSDWSGLRDADDGQASGYGWTDLAAAMATIQGHPVGTLFVPQPIAQSAAWMIGKGASLFGRAAMITPGKIRELYHGDWISREAVLRADPPTHLADGLQRTLVWYRQKGWLPDRLPADRNRLREGGVSSL